MDHRFGFGWSDFFLIQKIIKIPYIFWVFLTLPEVFDYYRITYIILLVFLHFLPVSSQSGHGIEAKITENRDGNKEYSDYSHLSLIDLETFPPFPFLRFDSIDTFISFPDYYEDEKAWDTQSIDAKCQFFEDQLKLIKPAFENTINQFHGQVDDDNSSRFADHSELLSYVRSRLLPDCDDKPRGYYFVIDLYSEKSAAKCVLSSLLQIPQVICCSDVRIEIDEADQIKLPVREISNWLHQNCDSHRERLLHIYLSDEYVNIVPMFTHLKAVYFLFLLKFLSKFLT